MSLLTPARDADRRTGATSTGATSTGSTSTGSDRGSDRPAWGRWVQLSVAAVAGVVYLSNLSANGLGNRYYAAAVKSGSVSWKAFFFGSLDPASLITVDKPPAAFWVEALSVRIFGYSSWSLLVPEAVAGTTAVAIVYHLARRLVLHRPAVGPSAAGMASGAVVAEVAGIVAGLALAFTPMAAVMFRFNDLDAVLTFLLVVSAWAGWGPSNGGRSAIWSWPVSWPAWPSTSRCSRPWWWFPAWPWPGLSPLR